MKKSKVLVILMMFGIFANSIYAVNSDNSNGLFFISLLVCSIICIITAVMYINSVKRADEEVRRKRSEAAKKAAKTRKKNQKLKEQEEKNNKNKKENNK